MVKLTVLGSYNQDITMITPKIPRPKETITGATLFFNPGGKGNNQANAAHKLGADVFFIAKIGEDPFGTAAIEYFRSISMNAAGIMRDKNNRTGTAVILVDEKTRENQITVAPGANHAITITELENLKTEIESSDICIFQLETNTDAILHTMKIAKKTKSIVILNPAPIPENFPVDLLKNVDILIMNEIEATAISKFNVVSKESALEAAKIITESYDVISIITLGSNGVIVWDGSQDYFHHSFSVEVKDTTGAGDAFIGSFAVKYGVSKNLFKSIRYASAAAAIKVTRLGASSANPTKDEVENFLKSHTR